MVLSLLGPGPRCRRCRVRPTARANRLCLICRLELQHASRLLAADRAMREGGSAGADAEHLRLLRATGQRFTERRG